MAEFGTLFIGWGFLGYMSLVFGSHKTWYKETMDGTVWIICLIPCPEYEMRAVFMPKMPKNARSRVCTVDFPQNTSHNWIHSLFTIVFMLILQYKHVLSDGVSHKPPKIRLKHGRS